MSFATLGLIAGGTPGSRSRSSDRPRGRFDTDTGDWTTWRDHVSLVLGVQLPDPRSAFAVGVGVEIVRGVHIVVAYQPHKRQPLTGTARSLGDAIDGSTVPTNTTSDFRDDWTVLGAGLMLDSTLLSALF